MIDFFAIVSCQDTNGSSATAVEKILTHRIVASQSDDFIIGSSFLNAKLWIADDSSRVPSEILQV
jgi:hypothetical protein